MAIRLRSAFTLIELLVVIAIVVILMAILLPTIGQARKTAQRVVCMSNMGQFGKTTGTYAADFHDRIYSFTWTRNKDFSKYSDLNGATDDLTAAANQAVDIIRRRGDYPGMPKIGLWIPHVYYTHLVLQDYLNARLPDATVVCPADKYRLMWHKYAKDWPGDAWPAPNPPGDPAGKRWPFSSSYRHVIASFERTESPGDRIMPAAHNAVYTGDKDRMNLGNQKMGECVFPSSKVLLYDHIVRHFGRQFGFWGYDDVYNPVTFFDASVRIVHVAKSNNGWQPRNPTSPQPSYISYNPGNPQFMPPRQIWEPPARSPYGVDFYIGRYEWTRGGIKGVDYGGGEVSTGQPPAGP